MDLPFKRPLRIQPYFGHRTRDRLLLSARALHARKPGFAQRTRLGAMRTMVSQFLSWKAAGVQVRLELPGHDGTTSVHHGLTDEGGYVHFDIALDPPWDLPDDPVWELGAVHWDNAHGPQSAEIRVLAPAHDSKLAVISDIDDTIIETGVTGGFRSVLRNWRRLFAELPHERIAVPGADLFYDQLGGGMLPAEPAPVAYRLPATRRPFFYISSSPWNLFSYLVAFKRVKGLPLGPLKLRDWGLNRRTLGQQSHGEHKDAAIDGILAMYPALRFALIGDDTQGDLPAFARAVQLYPGRIAAVFLRTVSEHEFSAEEAEARHIIEQAGVPMWLGRTYEDGIDFLRTVGFTPGGETEQIVRTVEQAGDTDPAEPQSSVPVQGARG